jgi:hypothetical protein
VNIRFSLGMPGVAKKVFGNKNTAVPDGIKIMSRLTILGIAPSPPATAVGPQRWENNSH